MSHGYTAIICLELDDRLPLQPNNFKTANIAIYQSNIFAVLDNMGRNSTYDRVFIIPDPRGIPGTRNAPLYSSSADGIHVSLVRLTPHDLSQLASLESGVSSLA